MMPRYHVEVPEGWIRRPFPPPQRGIYVTSPPGTARLSVLLTDPLVPVGTLESQVTAIASQGCADVQVLEESRPFPLRAAPGLPGAATLRQVEARFEGKVHLELRVFMLLDVGTERLPVLLLGQPDGLAQHGSEIIGMLASVKRLHMTSDSLY